MRKRIFAALLLLACLPACASAKSVPQALREAICATHPAPFTKVSEAEFDAAVEALDADWAELTAGGEAGFALRELAASLGDEHTTVVEQTDQNAALPFFVMRIGEDFVIVQAQQEHADWAGCALDAIGGMPVGEIARRMTPYLSAETDGWRDVLAATEMVSMRMLVHIGAAQSMEEASVTVRDTRTGRTQTAAVHALTGEYDYGTSVLMPMAQTFAQSGYYYATLLEGGELFIQYNVCADDPQMPVADFAAALDEQLGANLPSPPDKIIVDLRHNGGGDSEVINPLLELLEGYRQRGSALYALIGPETFSSGVMDAMKLRDLGAVLVGEATGGVLGFGELKIVELGEGFTLGCSSVNFSGGQPHLPLEPDVKAAQTLEDMLDGIDTAVERVRSM